MHQKFNPEELAGFARFYGFHYDICDPQALIRDCLNDMERGLRGMPSDLPMQPAYLTPPARLPRNKKVIALDAGGTNLRAALVLVDGEGRIQAESIRKTYMPGSRGQVSAEDFFSQIADLTAPLIEEAGQIDGI
ncbi:MAG: hexokinase, partial [Treponema sp.]|nr:hexokinase [Treponema sp.]